MLKILGILSGLLMISTVIPYIKDIFLLKTKPERASWFIWSLLNFIAFFSQLAKGASYSLMLTAGDAVVVLTVFILSIKYGVGGLTKRDIIALIGVVLCLILWYFTGEAALALVLVIIIDLIGAILTIIKSYEDPHSETLITWTLAGVAGFLGVLAVGQLNPILLAYPLYICIINSMTALAVVIGRNRLNRMAK